MLLKLKFLKVLGLKIQKKVSKLLNIAYAYYGPEYRLKKNL